MLKQFAVIPFLFLTIACTSSVDTDPAVLISLENQEEFPKLFAENIISTPMNERDIAISQEGDEIVFTLGNYNSTKRALVHVKKKRDIWSSPEVLSFSGVYQDIEPFFSPDGNRLFFSSTRPIGGDSSRTDYNIWYVGMTESGFGEPMDAGEVINTTGDEFYPSVSRNGNLYFTANYDFGIGQEDIFISEWIDGAYTAPVPLSAAVNTQTYEFNSYVSPEEDLIIFSSFGREDDKGGGDLYLSQKDKDGNWMQSRNLGGLINSSSLDYCPFVDFERNNFYFTSNRTESTIVTDTPITIQDLKEEYNKILNGMGNIYKSDIVELDLGN